MAAEQKCWAVGVQQQMKWVAWGLQSWFLTEDGVHIPVLRPQHSWKGPWALLTLAERNVVDKTSLV